ncbi:MAG: glutathione S-transferase [Sphingomonadales bacterium]|nr:glutathione S-transferase [Sphingomonadales bacterium]
MNALPILYSFRRCPYAMRARMALLVSGTVCELREVKLSDKPAELIAISPKATVPVLLTAEGQVVDQSIDIMHWALARNDPEDWLAAVDDPLIAANDGPFKYHLDRYKYPNRHQSDPIEHRAAAIDMLQVLEDRLTVSDNLSRPARSLVDLAIMPFVRQFANTDRTFFDAAPLPKLQKWLATHIASPLFETAMTNHPRWCGPDVHPVALLHFSDDGHASAPQAL